MNKHIPVLLNESVEAFSSLFSPDRPSGTEGTVVDCTLGGGGHAAALLERYPALRVLACDVDENAIRAGRERLKPYGERIGFHHGNFSGIVDLEISAFPPEFGPPWAGVLMDLGYSSNQLESPDYGMSFAVDAPLDMRLSRTGATAWDLMQDCSAQELGDILKAYGEMPGAHKLAQRIQEGVGIGKITNSTKSLAVFLERATGGWHPGEKIHPATLVFQALRIAVNDELRALDHFLEGVILKVKASGRIAVITFHSLEDRIVKRWGLKHASVLKAITKKPIVATQEEVKANPRSRSAKLRIYEKA